VELGDIGIREFGECLLAVERRIASAPQLEGAGGGGEGAKRQGGGGGSKRKCERQALHSFRASSGRLDGLAAPKGGIARVGARTRGGAEATAVDAVDAPAARRGLRAGEGQGEAEAVVVAMGTGSQRGKVVAVVKQPLKRWNSMLGTYTDVERKGTG
jgi:hypothetical protein